MFVERLEKQHKIAREAHEEQCARQQRAEAALALATKELSRPRPDAPGDWFWVEWGAEVKVYTKKGKGRRLYVTPPGGVEVLITPKIAGGWIALAEHSANHRVSDSERRPVGESGPIDGVHST